MNNYFIAYSTLYNIFKTQKKTYIDLIIPYVEETLFQIDKTIASSIEVQDKLNELFLLYLPNHVIIKILEILIRKGLLKQSQSGYIIIKEAIKSKDFLKHRDSLIIKMTCIVKNLCEFQNNIRPGKEWDLTKTEDYFFQYLNENYFEIQDLKSENYIINDYLNYKCIIARYIKNLYENKSSLFQDIMEILYGNILYKAICYTPIDNEKILNENTLIYDTGFIMSLLGYNGDTLEKPAKEVISLLAGMNVYNKIFSHTLDEVLHFLNSSITDISSTYSNKDVSRCTKNFVSKGYSIIQIEKEIHDVEFNLKKYGITICDSPKYLSDDTFNIEDFTLNLKKAKPPTDQRSIDSDVKSIEYIFQYAKGKRTQLYSEVPYLFISSSRKLITLASEYYKKFYSIDNHFLTPFLIEYDLAALLWLTNAKKIFNFANIKIYSDCLLLIDPPAQLMQQIIDKAKTMLDENKINNDEFIRLKYSTSIRAHISQNIDEFVESDNLIGSIYDVLDNKNSEKNMSYKYEIQRLTEENSMSKEENKRLARTHKKLFNISLRISMFLVKIPFVVPAILVALDFPKQFDYKYLLRILFISAFNIVTVIYCPPLVELFKRIETKISKVLLRKLYDIK
jgi:hypothetical protein